MKVKHKLRSFLLSVLKPFIKRKATDILMGNDIKKFVATKVNEKVDLPKLSEAEEQKLFEQFYSVFAEAVVTIVDRL